MARFTLQRAAELLQRGSARLPLQLKLAVAETGHAAYRRAVRLSSGPLTTKELRRRGHPYARRHGRPRLSPARINVQSDVFRQAWATEGPLETGDTITFNVFNPAPYARFLDDGTQWMFERPLPERVMAETEPELERRVAAAFRDAFR